jgi:catechol 2,3-dioxygenase-like lactoylglutathione lyase family enzyme
MSNPVQLDHVNIKGPMDLLEREKRFFIDVLGLREGERPNLSSRGHWLYAGEQAIVHLSESAATDSEDQGPVDHVAFRSSGLEDLIGILEAGKIEYSTVYIPDVDLTQVFLRAPSSTRIEVNFPGERLRAGSERF